jgi:hypothetical protein
MMFRTSIRKLVRQSVAQALAAAKASVHPKIRRIEGFALVRTF